MNNNTDNVSSNEEKVKIRRYNLNVYSAAEGKKLKNVSSNLDDISATTTNNSNSNTNIHNVKEGKAPKDNSLNWNGIVAAVIANDDDINNAKLRPGCNNSIGDLDGIHHEYYQAERNNKDDKTATTTVITYIVSNKKIVLKDISIIPAMLSKKNPNFNSTDDTTVAADVAADNTDNIEFQISTAAVLTKY